MRFTFSRHCIAGESMNTRTELEPGDVLFDPHYGERYTVLTTSQTSSGARVQIHDVAAPGPSRRQASRHPFQTERFTVLTGTLNLEVNGQEHVLHADDTLLVPAGARHIPRNAGTEEVHFVTELEPAGRFEAFLAAITAVNQSGTTGFRYLIEAATVLRQFPDVERPTTLPLVIEQLLFGVLAILGRLLGHRPSTPQIMKSNSSHVETHNHKEMIG